MNKSFLKFLTDFGPLVIFFYYYYDSGKNLKIGEYSKPIMKNNGYMFLKINDKRQKKEKINKDLVFKNLMNEEKDRILNQFSVIYFNQLRNNSVIIKR